MNTTRLIAAIALLVFANVAQADDPDCAKGQNFVLVAFADEEIAVSTAAKALTTATYNPSGATNASMALITVDLADVRMRFSGSAATTDAGHVVADGSSVKVCTAELPLVSMIRDGGTDAEVTVTYWRAPI